MEGSLPSWNLDETVGAAADELDHSGFCSGGQRPILSVFAWRADAHLRLMIQIGDFVTYGNRAYRLVGITPMSVRPFAVQLEDPTTDELFWVQAEPQEAATGVIALDAPREAS
jgi:hypothetical protein